MNTVIQEKIYELVEICKKRRVHRLELFGSAAGKDFDSQRSDLDFLVKFEDLQPGEYADAYFGLLESLQQLFNREIDLVMLSAVKNKYFLQNIQATRTLIYSS